MLCTPILGPVECELIPNSFIDTTRSTVGWLPGNFSIRPRTLRSLQLAGLCGTIVGAIFNPEGSWSKLGNQSFTRENEGGSLKAFGMCYVSMHKIEPILMKTSRGFLPLCMWLGLYPRIHSIDPYQEPYNVLMYQLSASRTRVSQSSAER
jgi:hypothetical protein